MKKGISLIALVATIAIMIILISTVTISGINTANNSKKQAFATELAMIQESVDSYKIKTNGEYPVNNSIVVNTEKLSENVLTNQFSGENITDNTLILQEVDYTKIGITSLKYGYKKDGDGDVYAISTVTNKVYYVKGIKIGTNTYFTLTDDLRNMINYNLGTGSDLVQEGIIFTPTETEWTNADVNVVVKVPEAYSVNTFTANGNAVTASPSQDGYSIYNVTGITGRYSIKVAYTRNSQPKEATYNVDNVDKVNPTLVLKDDNEDGKTDQILMQDKDKNTSYAYMSITSKTDDISGVKVVKYENENIPDPSVEQYFETNGKVITNDVVPIAKDVQYITVYVEDNAGNWTARRIPIDPAVYSGLITGPNAENVPIKVGNAPVLATRYDPYKMGYKWKYGYNNSHRY